MRSCDEIAELISASLDDDLPADEQAALDEHIACCPACRTLLDDLRALHIAAANWEDTPAPAGFTEAVMSAIAAEATQKKQDNLIPFAAGKAVRSRWKKWGVSAAAIAVVVLGAVSAPSLLGNFNAAKSTSFNDSMECQSISDDTYSVDTKSQSHTIDENLNSIQDQTAPRDTAESADLVPEMQTPLTTRPDTESYVGELVLDGMPEALAGQEGFVGSDGTVTYIVSADLFTEIFRELEAEQSMGYSYTVGDVDADRGKIIVQSFI